MLDHDIAVPSGWETAWLERNLPLQHCYLNAVSYILSITIIALSLIGYVAVRNSTFELNANPSRRSEIFSRVDKKVVKLAKGHFIVANIFLLHVLAIAMVDAFICTVALREDVSADPDTWTTEFLSEVAMYVLYLMVVFAASFVLVPLVQMLVVTWCLARFSKQLGSQALADYIPEARFLSTHLAQIWSMACFFATAWWSPTRNDAVWRFVVLQASFGSALAWLQASFAFNYRFDRLEDFRVTKGGLREILLMFSKTAKVVHAYSIRSTRDGLPRYEELAQGLVVVDEKS